MVAGWRAAPDAGVRGIALRSGRCGDGCGRSVARGSGDVSDRVCGFMHRDERAEHRKTGERETAGNTPVWNKCPECYTEDR